MSKKKVNKKKGISFTRKTITIRKPRKASIISLQNKIEKKQRELRKKEKPSIRYSFHIESLKVDKFNIVSEIIFNYKGTLYIPKSQKQNYKPANAEVSGTFTIPHNIEHEITTTDFNYIKRSQMISLLKNNLRKEYIKDMQEMIKKEILPDYKIIDELPWKY
tara:strand:+ start:451 stop:936 length:486 start_codon:yes stop_codon:yes gene_type:complete